MATASGGVKRSPIYQLIEGGILEHWLQLKMFGYFRRPTPLHAFTFS